MNKIQSRARGEEFAKIASVGRMMGLAALGVGGTLLWQNRAKAAGSFMNGNAGYDIKNYLTGTRKKVGKVVDAAKSNLDTTKKEVVKKPPVVNKVVDKVVARKRTPAEEEAYRDTKYAEKRLSQDQMNKDKKRLDTKARRDAIQSEYDLGGRLNTGIEEAKKTIAKPKYTAPAMTYSYSIPVKKNTNIK